MSASDFFTLGIFAACAFGGYFAHTKAMGTLTDWYEERLDEYRELLNDVKQPRNKLGQYAKRVPRL